METLKICSSCKQLKWETAFTKKSDTKDGLQSTCKECSSIYRKAHYKAKPDYYIAKTKEARKRRLTEREEFKKDLKCQVCGESRWWVLEFHHRDPKEKEYSIGRKSTRSMRKMQEEIKKCDVLCANCHKDHHYQERLKGVTGKPST